MSYSLRDDGESAFGRNAESGRFAGYYSTGNLHLFRGLDDEVAKVRVIKNKRRALRVMRQWLGGYNV